MNDPLIRTLASTLRELGYSTLRYNSRGVGQSSGRGSWTAHLEVNDLVNIGELMTNMGKKSIILCGYSYGSVIAVAAACKMNIICLVSISYPVSVLWSLTAFNSKIYIDSLNVLPNVPKLFITGTRDNFSTVEAWNEFVKKVPEKKELVVLEGDHFWRCDEPVPLIVDFIQSLPFGINSLHDKSNNKNNLMANQDL